MCIETHYLIVGAGPVGMTAAKLLSRSSNLSRSTIDVRQLSFCGLASAIGCSFATKENRHLEVTILRFIRGGLFAKPIIIIAYLLTILFCGSIAVWGTQMVIFLIRTGQKTQALEIGMFWIYIAIPLGMGLMGLRTCERLWLVLTGKIDPHGGMT